MSRHKHHEHPSCQKAGELDLDELAPRFAELQTWINLLTALIAVVIFVGGYATLDACSHLLANRDSTAIFVFYFSSVVWWGFPAIATTLSFEVVLQIWSVFGSRHISNAYSSWAAEQPKSYRGGTVYMDSRSVFTKLFLFLGVPIGVLTMLALNMHVSMTQQEIRQCGYAFQECKVIPYSSIRRISTVDGRWDKKGKFFSSPDIVIDFSDGSRRSEYDWTTGKRKELDTHLLSFLINKTGINPKAYLTESGIP